MGYVIMWKTTLHKKREGNSWDSKPPHGRDMVDGVLI